MKTDNELMYLLIKTIDRRGIINKLNSDNQYIMVFPNQYLDTCKMCIKVNIDNGWFIVYNGYLDTNSKSLRYSTQNHKVYTADASINNVYKVANHIQRMADSFTSKSFDIEKFNDKIIAYKLMDKLIKNDFPEEQYSKYTGHRVYSGYIIEWEIEYSNDQLPITIFATIDNGKILITWGHGRNLSIDYRYLNRLPLIDNIDEAASAIIDTLQNITDDLTHTYMEQEKMYITDDLTHTYMEQEKRNIMKDNKEIMDSLIEKIEKRIKIKVQNSSYHDSNFTCIWSVSNTIKLSLLVIMVKFIKGKYILTWGSVTYPITSVPDFKEETFVNMDMLIESIYTKTQDFKEINKAKIKGSYKENKSKKNKDMQTKKDIIKESHKIIMNALIRRVEEKGLPSPCVHKSVLKWTINNNDNSLIIKAKVKNARITIDCKKEGPNVKYGLDAISYALDVVYTDIDEAAAYISIKINTFKGETNENANRK